MQWYLKAPSLVRDDTLPYYFNPSIRSFHQQNQWHWQLTPDPDSSWTHRPLASFPCFEVQAFPHLPGWQAPPVPSNSEHCRRASACGIITTTAAAQSQTDQIQTDTQPNDPQKKKWRSRPCRKNYPRRRGRRWRTQRKRRSLPYPLRWMNGAMRVQWNCSNRLSGNRMNCSLIGSIAVGRCGGFTYIHWISPQKWLKCETKDAISTRVPIKEGDNCYMALFDLHFPT